MSLQKKTIFQSIIYILLFSSVFVLTKQIIPPLNGMTYVFLRTGVGGIFIGIYLLQQRKLKTLWARLSQNKWDVFLTAIYLGLSLNLSFVATAYINPANQSLLLNLTSIFIILLNLAVYKIIPKPIILISAILTFVGIILVMWPIEFDLNNSNLGDLLMILSTIFGAIYTIKMEKLAKRYDNAHLSFSFALIIFVIMIPLYFLIDGPSQFAQLSSTKLIILLILGIGITGFLYTISGSIMADPEMTSNLMAIIVTLVPIFGVILGVLFYEENMTPINIFGAIIVFIGVFIINFQKESKNKATIPEEIS